MNIILAPDSFKGSLSATAAAEYMARGTSEIMPDARITKLPLSDGGEGLVESLVTATGGQIFYQQVTGPLGNPVNAFWGMLGDGITAVVEMAAASGLLLIPEEQKNPMISTTFGTGELIKSALDKRCSRLIIGIGGSATNDGGAGMVQSLGARLLDKQGKELSFGGGQLAQLAKIDVSGLDPRLKEVEILVACDVDNPLTGPTGASYIYGPQKGATAEMVQILDAGLKHYAEVIKRDLKIDVEHIPGAGAAGGLGAGLLAFLEGRLTPGIDLVMQTVGLGEKLVDCDLVITGEGKLDGQSAYGKVPVGVARKAKRFGVPVVVLAGSITEDAEVLHQEGITAQFSIINAPMLLSEAMSKTGQLLECTTKEVLRLFIARNSFREHKTSKT
jgi:glycerate kinase